MVYCRKCGNELRENAEFCTKCGTSKNVTNESVSKNNDKKSLEKQIEKTAEEIGKKAELVGKKIERKANYYGNHLNEWYDHTFKITGPLIGAFIALIIIRIIIYIIQASNEEIYIVTALGEGLYEYLLIIFFSMLLSGYNTYFNRKYKQQYQWIYPMISSIGCIIGAWVAAQIMLIISHSNETPILEAIGTFINSYLLVLFVLAIIIGYIVQIASNFYCPEEK